MPAVRGRASSSVTPPRDLGITLGAMPNSDSFSDGQKMSPGKKLGIFSLYACATGAVTCLLDHYFGPGAATTLGPVLYYIGAGAKDLIPNLVADRISDTVLNGRPSEAGTSGLNYDIERALARAASRSYRLLIAEWRKIPQTERLIDQHVWELERIERACDKYLAKSERGFEPSVIAGWLRELNLANFPQFPDSSLVPWRREGQAEPPKPPVEFAGWFHWRFPTVFRLEFADELAKDESARSKFSLLLKERILVLQAENHGVTLDNKKQLDELVSQLADRSAPWLRNIAQTVHAELQRFLPIMVEAISADLSFEFRALLGDAVDEIVDEVKNGNSETQQVVRDEAAAIPKAVVAQLEAKQAKASAHPLTWEQQVAAYEQITTTNFELVPISALGGVPESERIFTLSSLFVDPASEEFIAGPLEVFITPVAGGERIPATMENLTATTSSTLHALCKPTQRRHIILGGLGSGKSSVLRKLYLLWANLPPDERAVQPVPILVEIREFLGARNATEHDAVGHRIDTVIDYLTVRRKDDHYFDHDTLVTALDEGRAWLLVDGLDEAFAPHVRQSICKSLRAFAVLHPQARIIASSRVNAFAQHEWQDSRKEKGDFFWSFHTLSPYNQKKIDEFLERWFRVEVPGLHTRSTQQMEVASAIRSRPFLKPLAEVPLTLAMICALCQRGIQPTERIKVFEEAAKIFIQQWDNARGLPNDKVRLVERWREYGEKGRMAFFRSVAMKMVEGGKPNDSNRISRDDLQLMLVEQFTGKNESEPRWVAKQILDLICERNFLLTKLPGDAYAFFHRSFLEYFTALGWVEQFANSEFVDANGKKPDHRVFFEQIILPRWWEPTWHDTFRFLFGLLKAVPAAHCLQSLVEIPEVELPRTLEMMDIEPNDRGWAAVVLAAELAEEVQEYTPKSGIPITPKSIVAPWKLGLLKYGRELPGFGERRLALCNRGLHAVVRIWQGDEETAHELAALLLLDTVWPELDRQLGRAMAAILPGSRKLFALLREILDDPCRSILELKGVANTAHPVTAAILAPYLEMEIAAKVRRSATCALGAGWPGDPEACEVLLRALAGVPVTLGGDCNRGREGTINWMGADEDVEVQRSAVVALGQGWAGDDKVLAVLVRVLERIVNDGKYRDENDLVRIDVAWVLSENWKGNPLALTALERFTAETQGNGNWGESARSALENYRA